MLVGGRQQFDPGDCDDVGVEAFPKNPYLVLVLEALQEALQAMLCRKL